MSLSIQENNTNQPLSNKCRKKNSQRKHSHPKYERCNLNIHIKYVFSYNWYSKYGQWFQKSELLMVSFAQVGRTKPNPQQWMLIYAEAGLICLELGKSKTFLFLVCRWKHLSWFLLSFGGTSYWSNPSWDDYPTGVWRKCIGAPPKISSALSVHRSKLAAPAYW